MKLTRVRFLSSPTGAPFFLAYNAGEFANVPEQVADGLVKAKIAELAPQESKATPPATEEKTETRESKKQTEKRGK